MESFLFADTFKYYYLLFAPRKTLDFDGIIFNTEAHPLRRASAAAKKMKKLERRSAAGSSIRVQSAYFLLGAGPGKEAQWVSQFG